MRIWDEVGLAAPRQLADFRQPSELSKLSADFVSMKLFERSHISSQVFTEWAAGKSEGQ